MCTHLQLVLSLDFDLRYILFVKGQVMVPRYWGIAPKYWGMVPIYWGIGYKFLTRVAETVPDKASVHTGNTTFGTISVPEQDYFVPFPKDLIPATQRCTCSCSHYTSSVSATLRFTIRYSVYIAPVFVCKQSFV